LRVGLEPQHVVEALLHEPDQVVVLVPGSRQPSAFLTARFQPSSFGLWSDRNRLPTTCGPHTGTSIRRMPGLGAP
jgi:hypothetical protein